MAILQPRSRLNAEQEFTDRFEGTTSNERLDALEFPPINSKDSPISNFMTFYINQLEDLDEIYRIIDSGRDARNYVRYTGWEYSTVPRKNVLTQRGIQDRLISGKSNRSRMEEGIQDNIVQPDVENVDYNFDFLGSLLKKHSRTEIAFSLMMPSSVRFGTRAGWEDVNSLKGIGVILGEVFSPDNLTGQDKIDALKRVGSIMAMEGTQLGLNTFIGDGVGDALTGTLKNSFMDQAFTGMQRRGFQFSWLLSPKNEQELRSIDEIIRLLRFHSHPTFSPVSESGAYLLFPSHVDVEFYTRDVDTQGNPSDDFTENAWIPKISTCVVESIETDYSPNAQFAFFKGSGAPTQINLTITLKEIAPLVREDIARGF